MNLFSGLEKFGLKLDNNKNIYEEDKKEALRCGMNGHIAKPIDIDNLFGTLRQILK